MTPGQNSDELLEEYEGKRDLPPYQVDSLLELLKERQELNWVVENWIEAGTLAVLVGPEGSFKSFLAIDWCMAIATGRDWHDSRVKEGRVLYIAGEGRKGVIRRMRGWCDYYKVVPDDLFLGQSPIQLLDPKDADRIADLGEFQFIVIDTLARNFGPGSENDQKDMSLAIRTADHIRESTGATVLIVHHTPLEGREEGKLRPRGSSALAGGADSIFTCQYDKASKVVTVNSIKQKDAANPETRFLSFEVVDLGDKDNFENEITTVVLCETHMRPVSRKPLGKNQKQLIRELQKMANGSPDLLLAIREVTESMSIPSRSGRLKLEEWFFEQPWSRPSVGGHRVDMEQLPSV